MGLKAADMVLFGLVAAIPLGSSALAQAVNYTRLQAVGTKPVQLTYHASAHKDCTPAALPTIKVTSPPQDGLLIVRKGELATNKISGCGRVQLPVQVVLYQAKEHYVGPDHVCYEVTSENGEVTTYDITVKVDSAPTPTAPASKPETKI